MIMSLLVLKKDIVNCISQFCIFRCEICERQFELMDNE